MTTTTNRENVQKVLDFLKALPDEKVDMRDYFLHNDMTILNPAEFSTLVESCECGTAACLAGWAIHLLATPKQKSSFTHPVKLASQLLGFNNASLFVSSRAYDKPLLSMVTRQDVIQKLEKLLAQPK